MGFPHRRFKWFVRNCTIGMCPAWGLDRQMRGFLADRRGNYALMTVVAMVPLMGGLALAVDYCGNEPAEAGGEQRARRGRHRDGAASSSTGASDSRADRLRAEILRSQSRLGRPRRHPAYRHAAANQVGGGTLKLSAKLNYKPLFYPVFAELSGHAGRSRECRYQLRDKHGNPPEEHAGSGAGPR